MYSEFTGTYPASLIPSGFPPADMSAMEEYRVDPVAPPCNEFEHIPGVSACRNPAVSAGIEVSEVRPQTNLLQGARDQDLTIPM